MAGFSSKWGDLVCMRRAIVDNATKSVYTGTAKEGKTMLNEYEHQLNKYRNRFFDLRLGEIGLAGPPGFYLMKIAMLGPVRMNVVVDETPFHKSHATRAVMRLSQSGLIEKSVDSEDQRGFVLCMTPEGEKAAAFVARTLSEWDELVNSALNETERAALAEITEKMFRRVKHYFEEEIQR